MKNSLEQSGCGIYHCGLGTGQVYSLALTACCDRPDVIKPVGSMFRWLKQSCSLLEAGIHLLFKEEPTVLVFLTSKIFFAVSTA